ncbi:hypothetical protein RchiOBHm_Chr5g0039671 [Rosa chinensis]|uniref:Uncharacterized protein n=1 Tax=Rosa chinensis TaxID=74649 RepID=A0A2P6QCB9_ROSCH|nr:hypothetical protein RchiOBHm_Chr5g0039671 [Rosa chinensis]
MAAASASSSPSPQPQPDRTTFSSHSTPALPPAFSVILFLLVFFREITRKHTGPEANSKLPPHTHKRKITRNIFLISDNNSYSSTQ